MFILNILWYEADTREWGLLCLHMIRTTNNGGCIIRTATNQKSALKKYNRILDIFCICSKSDLKLNWIIFSKLKLLTIFYHNLEPSVYRHDLCHETKCQITPWARLVDFLIWLALIFCWLAKKYFHACRESECYLAPLKFFVNVVVCNINTN